VACLLGCLVFAVASPAPGNFKVGSGIYDITGPAAEIGMMGYAQQNQKTHGLHLRLRARAYVFVDENNKRLVLVNLDLCMTFQMVKWKVIEQLQKLYGNLYSHDNVIISSIHTHSGPAGYSMYVLYDITSFGFYEEHFNTIVAGVVEAIRQAHVNVRPAKMFLNAGVLDGANINRSPSAYLMNPKSEISRYDYNTDHNFTLLRIEDSTGKDYGMINWFSVHCTSMNNTNLLISSDNKGLAALLFEKHMNGPKSFPGRGSFVAVFQQSNEGDVSPNTRGPSCPDGSPCDDVHSTCNGKTQGCIAKGPGKTDYESTEIIAQKQLEEALNLYNAATIPVRGGVDYRHTWLYMPNITVSANYTHSGKQEHLCRAGLGYSFAAGTTDGPGDFDFTQADNNTAGNPFWNFISQFLAKPTKEQKECQAPKPILLDVGETGLIERIPWAPWILPIQIARIGQLYIVAVPGEFTTMSGRRLRDTIYQALRNAGAGSDIVVIIAGLSNSYSHYIATYEEYQQQRYEGASTLYGPNTLAAYQEQYSKLAVAMTLGKPVPHGPNPPDLSNNTITKVTFVPPIPTDTTPLFKHFGEVEQDVAKTYSRNQTVEVVFWGANPRNNFMTNNTFTSVELNSNSVWTRVADDSFWETKLFWKSRELTQSLVTITWDIPSDAALGTYRIVHFGYRKTLEGKIVPYSGTSSAFVVNA